MSLETSRMTACAMTSHGDKRGPRRSPQAGTERRSGTQAGGAAGNRAQEPSSAAHETIICPNGQTTLEAEGDERVAWEGPAVARDLLRRSVPAVTQLFRPRAFVRSISWTGS